MGVTPDSKLTGERGLVAAGGWWVCSFSYLCVGTLSSDTLKLET